MPRPGGKEKSKQRADEASDAEASRAESSLLARLAEQQERLRLAVEATGLGAWDYDLTTGELSWSDRCKAVFGLPADAAVTYDIFLGRLHPDDREPLSRIVSRALDPAGSGEYDTEYRAVWHDGTVRWIAAKGRAFFDGEGASRRAVRFTGTVLDTTERKQIEDTLRESEARFRNLADNAPVMVWVTDPTGYCSYLSKSWYEFTGQNEADALGFGWVDAVHPDDQAMAHESFVDANARRTPYRVEFRLRNKAGEYRWAIDAAAPRFGDDGEYLGFVGSVIDITERKEADERIRSNEERLRNIFNGQFQSMAILSPEGVLQDVNDFALRGTGITRDQVIGKLFWETFWWENLPEMQAGWRARLDEAARTGEPVLTVDSYQVGDEVRTADASVTGVKGADGRIEFFIIQASDITERRRAEEARQRTEERYRQLADAMPQLVWETDGDGKHLYYNQQWYDYTGLTEEESMGYGFALALHPDDKERTIKNWERAWRHGEAYKIEYRFYSRPQGIYRWFLGRATPLRDASGEITRWVGTCTDIDDQKQMAAQLERLNAERAAMLEEVSTPVVPVLPGVLALPLIGSLDTERMQRATEAALSEVTRTGAHTCIIDITGARIIDSYAVANLANLVAALRLIGAEAIVTGVSAQAAHSLVGLGLDLAQVRTQRTLAQALSSVANRNTKQRINHQGTGLTVNGTTSNTR